MEPKVQHEAVDAYEALVQFLYRAPIGLAQTSLDGTVDMLNPMASRLLMPLATAQGLDNLFDVLAPVAPHLASMVEAFLEPSGMICEGLRLPVGVPHAASGSLQVLALNLMKLDPERLMATVADATFEVQREQEVLSRRLRNAARTDNLTRMPNREAVRDALQHLLAQPVSDVGFAVLTLNCDRFRQLNDSLGQAVGDHLLMHMADRLRGALRPALGRIEPGTQAGQLAARTGGDEFVVLLDGLRGRADAERIALRLLDALAHPYLVDGHDIVCGASVGLAWSQDDPEIALREPDDVLRDAGIAMVEAKRAGGNRHVVFAPSMRERAARRAGIEAELRQALVEEQLFVVYQPVVRLLPCGGVDYAAGVEALVRWRHPVRGIVPPIDFIEVAEECGLIGMLGDFVLERACRDFLDWRARLGDRAPGLMAVNLSRAQLAQPGWIDGVRRILRDTGMPPGCLQLEVTESLAAQDQDIQQRLHDLKALGIQLALDDFGTGYSSLSSLHLLPVDTVKIDRSFVCQADTSAHHRVLIEATVKVARSLGMTTVAEGIETQSQLDVVRNHLCDKVQGYFYSRPLPAPELLAWLATHDAEVH
ncbi:MAG: bifunctional diguanylate cyclase/phosphodiesterase [Massilia sp.]|uniref:putative bifunctional diguanylate cyclase/phosphodiesterase n=1 Tax=Massilia sp. TaxID=1882437 RepID=UPI0019B4EB97|nr:bifunctional diguanylate cyclase/phosphodiesterase [Oxalobacteraceae sp. CFBP 8761]MBD8627468.1 bifunctional diguanylate cyclase/phosphodiesterase [Oxalobacteraceae sp. CFBP 8753]MBD8631911.1 bifunctional diguanylate cyclase/phosphodiesterase [Oxalobacteraceae sp. CFBP 8755]MBD8726012.1 bifunctional diguanylate cyclase/phosphodiesterase [Oxalobacteraceae sp. CFBP 13708]